MMRMVYLSDSVTDQTTAELLPTCILSKQYILMPSPTHKMNISSIYFRHGLAI